MKRIRTGSDSNVPLLVVLAIALGATNASAHASFTWFQNNFMGWQAAAGSYSTCDFAAFPGNTFVTDQYADLGVLFTDPDPNVVELYSDLFPLDGHGINGVCSVELTFAQPTFAVGAHGPDLWYVQLYSGTTAIYEGFHPPSTNGFGGVVSSVSFDRAVFHGLPPQAGNCDFVVFDNIYFSTVPAPAPLMTLLAFAAINSRDRRGHQRR